ncbi:unnamed protein product [Allacma fusca]|uniref:Transposase n=1 Tax=Allacma fusca TaxID=39272 RepID=A0A8J2NSG7_9HEXA|nr:unnamed protein product [Allacma fusca]
MSTGLVKNITTMSYIIGFYCIILKSSEYIIETQVRQQILDSISESYPVNIHDVDVPAEVCSESDTSHGNHLPPISEIDNITVDNRSNDQHTCELAEESSAESESHFLRREKGLYEEASKMSECFNFKLAELSSRHSLSNSCVEDILKLCQQLIYTADEVPLPKTFKTWDASFENNNLVDVNFYWICDTCTNVNFRPLKDTPFSMFCCGKQITQTDDHFVIFNIADILEIKLPIVQPKFKRSIQSQRLQEVISKYHITEDDVLLTLNVDGVPRCTSSTAALYPVFVYFDDLSHRKKKEHIMIFGVWVGKEGGKLHVKPFLSPVIEQLRALQDNGLKWKNREGNFIISRVFITSVLCDSIARPQVQGMKQFNAEYGCGYCFHKETGHYFSPRTFQAALRTNEDHRNLTATTTDTFGIKDDCVFEALPYFDMILGKLKFILLYLNVP